jgi:hypothetical protein
MITTNLVDPQSGRTTYNIDLGYHSINEFYSVEELKNELLRLSRLLNKNIPYESSAMID